MNFKILLLDLGSGVPEPSYIFYYVLSGLFGSGLLFLIIFIANKYAKTQDAMVVRMQEMTLEQALQKRDITEIKDDQEIQTVKIERLERNMTKGYNEEFADMLVQKIRAITPP